MKGMVFINKTRLRRVNDEILRESAEIIRAGGLRDARVSGLISVTDVETTQDLKFCKIFVSVMGGDDEKKSSLEGLRASAPLLRKLLANRINLRNTPEISFELDNSLDNGFKISRILDGIRESGGLSDDAEEAGGQQERG
ncbi:MAG: 30S ribosome-binding factor RbfA [Clostridiales bacterium]|jgi:ribosome-binding factor A|nr:30S ribosome-binding factor RbfA [Clostridiales bacterium]